MQAAGSACGVHALLTLPLFPVAQAAEPVAKHRADQQRTHDDQKGIKKAKHPALLQSGVCSDMASSL